MRKIVGDKMTINRLSVGKVNKHTVEHWRVFLWHLTRLASYTEITSDSCQKFGTEVLQFWRGKNDSRKR